MPIPKNDPYKPRKCRFCKLLFKPTGKDRGNAQKQEFCTAAHRKEFWKHGGLPYQKLLDKLEKAVVKILNDRIREVVREEIKLALRIPLTQLNLLWARNGEAAQVFYDGLDTAAVKTEPRPDAIDSRAMGDSLPIL
jgi:hypothetical protein